ncbi:MAG: hypothetical protein Q8J97_04880, partial [Flavobacteriaceae bacterium]|nr:hypothetical protein [Flavobacteriaceae bacterium]
NEQCHDHACAYGFQQSLAQFHHIAVGLRFIIALCQSVSFAVVLRAANADGNTDSNVLEFGAAN